MFLLVIVKVQISRFLSRGQHTHVFVTLRKTKLKSGEVGKRGGGWGGVGGGWEWRVVGRVRRWRNEGGHECVRGYESGWWWWWWWLWGSLRSSYGAQFKTL